MMGDPNARPPSAAARDSSTRHEVMYELIDLVKFVVDRALVTQMQTATQ